MTNKLQPRDVFRRTVRHGSRAPWEKGPTLFERHYELLRWAAEQGEIIPPLVALALFLAGTWFVCVVWP